MPTLDTSLDLQLLEDGRPVRLDAAQVRARLGFELSLGLTMPDDEVRRAVARDAEVIADRRRNRQLLARHAGVLAAPARVLAQVAVGDAGPLGWGLFATTALARDDLAAVYSGEVLCAQDADPDDAYVLAYHRTYRCPAGLACRAPGHELDLSARRVGGPARFINGSHAADANLRLEVVAWEHLLLPCFVATRPIAGGEQLRWDYGEAYWARWAQVTPRRD